MCTQAAVNAGGRGEDCEAVYPLTEDDMATCSIASWQDKEDMKEEEEETKDMRTEEEEREDDDQTDRTQGEDQRTISDAEGEVEDMDVKKHDEL